MNLAKLSVAQNWIGAGYVLLICGYLSFLALTIWSDLPIRRNWFWGAAPMLLFMPIFVLTYFARKENEKRVG